MGIFKSLSITPEEQKINFQLRAVLAGMFSLALITGFFMKLVDPGAFLAIAGMVVSYYFASKGNDNDKDNAVTPIPKPPEVIK